MCQVSILKERGHKSAASIGEAICTKAMQDSADLVLIASHGR